MSSEAELVELLDARHDEARAAFDARDIDRYRDGFTPDLTYVRADGQVLDRARLMRNVADQFRRVRRARSRFVRDGLVMEGEMAVETLRQDAEVEIVAFGFLKRIWSMHREGRYSWVVQDGVWRIARVELTVERPSSRWAMGT